MLDNDAQERLQNLTIEEVFQAVKEFKECSKIAEDTGEEVSLIDKPGVLPLRLIFSNVPDVAGPSSTIKLIPDPLAVCYIWKMNPGLYKVLTEKGAVKKDLLAQSLQQVISSLRDIADEVKHSQGYSFFH